ncbi:hypothetical protein HMPREF3222_00816 [Clostridium perfringens]|uniref:Uncharacterized protein n=1 Tax=Clostridium perfringens TaxID=1502 RepID=A0A133NBH1_CLOPF|nr:hypothetical protein [Clostridium perfringens]KXA13613.1 hypothetical protein HMPREF3222_00816 [Clostridium perfringens]
MLVAFINEVINPNLGEKVIMLHMYLGADTYFIIYAQTSYMGTI